MLRVAALIGRDFDLGLLERVVDVPEDDLLDLLDAAVRAGILVEVASTPGPLLVRARARAHDARGTSCRPRAARACTAGSPQAIEAAPRPRAVAGRARPPLRGGRAGGGRPRGGLRRARRRPGHGPPGLRGGGRPAGGRLAALRRRRRRAPAARAGRGRLGAWGASTRRATTFRRAAELARRDGVGGAASRTPRSATAGGPWVRYGIEDPAERRTCSKRRSRCCPRPTRRCACGCWRGWAAVLYFSHAERAARRLIEAAVAMAHRVGDDEALAAALSSAQFAFWRPGMVLSRLALAEELVEVTERIGHPERVAEAVIWRLGALLTLWPARRGGRRRRRAIAAIAERARPARADHAQRRVAIDARAARRPLGRGRGRRRAGAARGRAVAPILAAQEYVDGADAAAQRAAARSGS